MYPSMVFCCVEGSDVADLFKASSWIFDPKQVCQVLGIYFGVKRLLWHVGDLSRIIRRLLFKLSGKYTLFFVSLIFISALDPHSL